MSVSSVGASAPVSYTPPKAPPQVPAAPTVAAVSHAAKHAEHQHKPAPVEAASSSKTQSGLTQLQLGG